MGIKRSLLSTTYVAVFFLFTAAIVTSALAERTPWGYGTANGPSKWSTLSEKFIKCDEGNIQSPINIDTEMTKEMDLKELDFDYKSSPALRMINTGHTIKIDHNEPSVLRYSDGSGEFNLFQFHFHSPSEHTIDEARYDMEIHFIHRNRAGNIAIVALFIEEGEYNPEFDLMWDFLPTEVGDEDIFRSYNPVNLLPESKEYYKYTGSITTPPCIENVTWFILKEPIEMSPKQIEAFRDIFDHNIRPLQPLNNRTVRSSKVFIGDGDMGAPIDSEDSFEDTEGFFEDADEALEDTFPEDSLDDTNE